MADKGFLERRRLEIGEISAATGISRSTLSRVLNKPGVNVTADNMSRLCAYFSCSLSELAEYVPEEVPSAAAPPPRSPRQSAGKKLLTTKTRPAGSRAPRTRDA
jgi:putative transcriptional regulator